MSNLRLFTLTSLILSCFATALAAQGRLNGIKVTTALGSTETTGAGSPISRGSQTEPLVGPAGDGVHLALGLARAVTGAAIDWRTEFLFNRIKARHNIYLAVDYSPGRARMAQLSESYALLSGFNWRAFPGGSVSPYLVTSAGVYHTRLGTNPDDQDPRVTEIHSVTQPAVNAGAGIAARIASREWFLEARRHMLWSAKGGSYVPISFGVRW